MTPRGWLLLAGLVDLGLILGIAIAVVISAHRRPLGKDVPRV